MPKSIAVGLNKGYGVTKRDQVARPGSKKGHSSKRARLVKQVVREVTGFAPYEKRILELLRNGLDKRALRFSKKRLGTHQRGKKKREEMSDVLRLQAQQKQAEAAKAKK